MEFRARPLLSKVHLLFSPVILVGRGPKNTRIRGFTYGDGSKDLKDDLEIIGQ